MIRSPSTRPNGLRRKNKRPLPNLTVAIARSLRIKGLLNIQYVIYQDQVYVLEVNPRSSRTVPFMSKVTGLPIVDLATRVMLGESLSALGIEHGLKPAGDKVAVKVPVFPSPNCRRSNLRWGRR